MLEIKELKVLIVDDKLDSLIKIENILKDLNVRVLKAQSGQEALKHVSKHEVFLIIMNVGMPEMNGFETAEIMRGNQSTKNTPIIFITSVNREQKYVFKGYQLGAVDYLFKPIDPIILISKIKVFMGIYKNNYLLELRTKLLEQKIEELIQLRESNYKLEKLSFYDSLTGITNRRRFDDILDREWNRGIREQKELSLIMIDVDDFKNYNDNYGHVCGDACLRKVANTIYSTIKRSSDLVARYGGEEFIALLPNTSNQGALEVAEKIRKNIEELDIRHEYSSISDRLTVSLGVNSIIPTLSKCKIEFIEKADRALYRAKVQCKNIVANAIEI